MIDLKGRLFGHLTVLEYDVAKSLKTGREYWKCQCDCGNIVSVRADGLKSGKTKSCGCYQHSRLRGTVAYNRKDLTGMKFGELTVLEYFDTKNKKTRWLCRCSCGNLCIKSGNNLQRGRATCCKECGYRRTSQKMKGILNPNYHPELTDQDRQDRIDRRERVMDSPEYRRWRWSVFRRDNYTCQMCGKKKSGTLEAHHIVRWVDDKDKRYDIDNGITLCGDCHKKVHYGHNEVSE